MKIIIATASLGLVLSCTLGGCSKAKPAQLIASAVVATNEASADAARETDFKIKWKTGKKYLLRMETLQNSQPISNGKKAEPTTLSLSHDYAVSVVKELPGGGRELELKFEAQKFQYQNGSVTLLSFDSAQKASEDKGSFVAPILRKLAGARLKCETDSKGQLVKIVGFKALIKRMSGGNPQILAMIKSLFTEDNLRELVAFGLILESGHPVKADDTWPSHLELPDDIGLFVLDLNCTFKDWVPQDHWTCAHVEFNGRATSRPAPKGPPSAYEIDKGTCSGQIWFDPELGMVINSTGEQHLTLTLREGGKGPVMEVNQTTNLKLIKVADR